MDDQVLTVHIPLRSFKQQKEREAASYSYTQHHNTHLSLACYYDNPVGALFFFPGKS